MHPVRGKGRSHLHFLQFTNINLTSARRADTGRQKEGGVMSHRLPARACLKALNVKHLDFKPLNRKPLDLQADVQAKALAAIERTVYASDNCER
jgi:hypothetical protein